MEKKRNKISLLERKLLNPPSSLPVIISPIAREKIMISRLGPGSYNFSLSTLSGPSHKFGESLRFDLDDPFAKYMSIARKTSYPGFQLPDINLDIFRPISKLSKIKEEAGSLSNKLESVKNTKKKIQTDRKEKILRKLKDKNDKYEIRKRVKEFKSLAFRMLHILAICSMAWHMSRAVESVKERRRRIEKMVRIFGCICLGLGKFCLVLKKFRKNSAYRVITKAKTRMKTWITNRKSKYRSVIINFVESYLKNPLILIALNIFITTIVSIQRFWRKSLSFKSMCLLAKLQIFRKIQEIELTHIKHKEKYKIPKRVILKELVKIRETKLNKYIEAMRKYKHNHRKMVRNKTRIDLKVALTYGIRSSGTPIVNYPKPPHVNYTIKKKKYLRIINNLMHRKSLWDT